MSCCWPMNLFFVSHKWRRGASAAGLQDILEQKNLDDNGLRIFVLDGSDMTF